MKLRSIAFLFYTFFALGCVSGCALLSKSTPMTPRYFTPDLSPSDGQASSVPQSGQKLRLGTIKAGPHLRERMAYRTSEYEVAYYNERRWTERPEAYLRRSLSRALFEEYGFVRTISGASHTLDAELVAFEEIKTDDHLVHVEVVINVYDMDGRHLQRTVTNQKKVEGKEDEPQAVVRALADALRAVVSEIAQATNMHLNQSLPPSEGG
jgi:cholesterol transport system auxiliary component